MPGVEPLPVLLKCAVAIALIFTIDTIVLFRWLS